MRTLLLAISLLTLPPASADYRMVYVVEEPTATLSWSDELGIVMEFDVAEEVPLDAPLNYRYTNPATGVVTVTRWQILSIRRDGEMKHYRAILKPYSLERPTCPIPL